MEFVNPYIYAGIKHIPSKKAKKTRVRYYNTISSYSTDVKPISNIDKLESLLTTVCNKLGITIEEAKGTIRDAEIVRARQIYCYFAREMGYTYKKVASIINRDHATVIHGCKVVSNRQFDFKMLDDFNKVIENL